MHTCALLMALCGGSALAAPPDAPEIIQPSTDGQILHPADVHMEIAGFHDPDEDEHVCTDWQIWTASSPELTWQADCAGGVEKNHTHLGDGEFVNSHAERAALLFGSEYELRVRTHDSSAEVSAWAQRPFETSGPGPAGEAAEVPWKVDRPDFEVGVFATGFQLPVNIAMLPEPGGDPSDPLLYVAELYGSIKAVTRDGSVGDYATNLLNFDPTGNFPGSGELGVTGIVVDPKSGDLFAAMVYEDTNSMAEPKPHYAKVVRFHSHGNGLVASGSETVLDMTGEPQGPSHQISNLTIGPDGHLYVHNGEGGNISAPQDLNDFRGKVLRMTLNGDPLPDNPFYDEGDGLDARDYVYAYGFRNPFGGAWRASNNSHYEVENGPSVDRLARVDAGANYCWLAARLAPSCEWDNPNDTMRIHALFNWEPSHAPVNIAFVQPATAGGSGFPEGMMDHAFVTESGPTYAVGPQLRGKRIVEFAPDESGELGGPPVTFVEYTGAGRATAVGLAAGDDGLYFTDLYEDTGESGPIASGANVLKVRYTKQTDPPPHAAPDTLAAAPLPEPLLPIPTAALVGEPTGRAIARRVAWVRRGRALLRLRCGGAGPCRGVARIAARVPRPKGMPGRRWIFAGRVRFSIAPRQARVVPVRLRRGAVRLLRRFGRRGISAVLGGRQVRRRVLRLRLRVRRRSVHGHGPKPAAAPRPSPAAGRARAAPGAGA